MDEESFSFYSNPCTEVTQDHARHVTLNQYVACIRISNNWVVPLNDTATWLHVPAVVDFLVGCCIWNPEFGYFSVTAFDKNVQKIQIQRKDVETTAAPGTPVPGCTKFIITPDV
jgi:hypothetical protein